MQELKKTPSNISTLRKCKGDFIYFGIEAGLLNLLSQNIDLRSLTCLKLIANIDGLPIFKSTGAQFWPILLNLNGLVFLVALYYGYQKPTPVEEYLEEFLNELTVLTREGVQIFGKQYEVKLKCFVCDAPARSYLKGIVNHTGYYSCERCTIKGECASRVVFNELGEQEPRTDEKFQNYQHPQHQKVASPLINAGIKCIEQFPLDYMHMVCLGVVKRIVSFLKRGPRICKLSCQQLEVISEQLVSFNGLFPSEFSRQPRSLFESDKWKATEFRQFLLYTGPIVLKDFLQIEMYEHFLCLSVAMHILLTDKTEFRNHYANFAKQLLQYFVAHSHRFYGETFAVYNMHGMIHISEDMRFASSMNGISSFPF